MVIPRDMRECGTYTVWTMATRKKEQQRNNKEISGLKIRAVILKINTGGIQNELSGHLTT